MGATNVKNIMDFYSISLYYSLCTPAYYNNNNTIIIIIMWCAEWLLVIIRQNNIFIYLFKIPIHKSLNSKTMRS